MYWGATLRECDLFGTQLRNDFKKKKKMEHTLRLPPRIAYE